VVENEASIMKLSRTIGSIVLVLMSSLVLQAQSVGPSPTTELMGKLSGLILDPGEARVPAAKIIIEREGFRREVVSTNAGSYELDLPIANYTVTVIRDGFYPSRKSGVSIRSDSVTTLNVTLKGILIGEDLVPIKELHTETVILNTSIQLRKLQDN
jgi:hypothetical protein